MTWLKGLLAAFISGAASAVTASIVDPIAFPLTDLKKVGTLAFVSGIVGVALYLKQSPVPTDEDLMRLKSTWRLVVLPPLLLPTLLPALLLGAASGVVACAPAARFAPGVTPQQGLAYEMREALVHLRGAQEALIAAVDQGRVSAADVDAFLVQVRRIFVFTRDRLAPKLAAFDELQRLGAAERAAAAKAELAPLLGEWNALATQLLAARLPTGLLEPLTVLAGELRQALRMTRTEFRLQVTF